MNVSSPRSCLCIILLVLLFAGAERSFAHREYVHQYLAIEAYKLLLDRYPALASSEFTNHIGTQSGGCAGFQFTDGTIAGGAYREDCEDPVYHYGDAVPPLDEAYFSASHFWDADAGDRSTIRICDLACGEYQNAFQKSLRYVLPGIYGTWTAKLTWPAGYSSFTLQAGGTGTIFHAGQIGFDYDSLAQLYRDGKCSITGYLDLSGRWQTPATLPDKLPMKIIAPKNVRDRIAWEVIGRIAHLLGDMGVPAHAHNDIHPPFWWYNEPADVFEEEMGRLYTAWTFEDAADQGGLLDVRRASPGGRAEDALRYLVYTTNQVADRFPSDDADGDSRYDLAWGNDDYSVLGIIAEITTDPAAGNVFHREAAEYAFVFSIRAIAGLYAWFALETGMLGDIAVAADFPGAIVLIDGKPQSTPAAFISGEGSVFTLHAQDQAAADSASNECMLRFRGWERFLPSAGASFVATSPLTEFAEDGARYTASFMREVTITLSAPVHTDGGSGGRYTVNGTDVGPSWSGPLNISIIPQMTIGFSPPAGSVFLRWSDNATGNPRVIRPKGNMTLHAVCKEEAASTMPVLSGTVTSVGSASCPRLTWTVPQSVTAARLYRYICSDSAGCAIASRRPTLLYDGAATVYIDGSVSVSPKSAGRSRVFYYVVGTGQGFTTGPSNTVSFATNIDVVYSAGGTERRVPESTGLEQNYPNPFNPSTTIPYRLASDGYVTLTVFNLVGERVALLYEGGRTAGYYTAAWDAAGNPAGVYIITMEVDGTAAGGGYRERRKILLIR